MVTRGYGDRWGIVTGRSVGLVGLIFKTLRFFDTHLRSRDTFFLPFSSTCCVHTILTCVYHCDTTSMLVKNVKKKYKSQIDYVSIFGLAGR